jgi:hypothetical protein
MKRKKELAEEEENVAPEAEDSAGPTDLLAAADEEDVIF